MFSGRVGRWGRRAANPFRFFDAIYCINLDSRPDRWSEAQREFTAVGIAARVERVAAIVHTDREESCRLSHLECIRRGAGTGAETVLIFEDDVTFPQFSPRALAASLERLRDVPDWELFYLGGVILGTPTHVRPELFRAPVAQTHAYAVHRRAFVKLQASTVPYDIWCANSLTSYCAEPLLAWQRDGFSDIAGTWASRASYAKSSYAEHRPPDDPVVLLRTVEQSVGGRLGRRLARVRVQRRLGYGLVRLAARLGIELRFEGGRPRVARRRRG